MSASPATVVVTGASKGIGLALAALYTSRGDAVIAVVRKATPALVALPGIRVVEGVDFEFDDAAEKVVAGLGSTRIDLLVNNAVRGSALCDLCATCPSSPRPA